MKKTIYSIFYNKLPTNITALLPTNEPKTVTFLNPYYMEIVKRETCLYEKFNYICSDGMIPIFLNKLTGHKKSLRISFDMTSLGKLVLQYAEKHQLGIFFIGAKDVEIKKFVTIIKQEYPHLNIIGSHHGYIADCNDDICLQIISSAPHIVIIGMGAPKQDRFAINLQKCGYQGTIYTCGGFIHQTCQKINYYPRWIDKLNLRTFYRLLHEPYVWKRVIRYYPAFVFKYTHYLLSKDRKAYNNSSSLGLKNRVQIL